MNMSFKRFTTPTSKVFFIVNLCNIHFLGEVDFWERSEILDYCGKKPNCWIVLKIKNNKNFNYKMNYNILNNQTRNNFLVVQKVDGSTFICSNAFLNSIEVGVKTNIVITASFSYLETENKCIIAKCETLIKNYTGNTNE